MKKIMKPLMALITIGALVLTSCNNDDDDKVDYNTLHVNFNGLENLGNDYVYEGWIIVNGSPVSTGTFTVDDNGVLSTSSFQVEKNILDAATTFVLSIEPAQDTDPAPANTKILGGDFSDNKAALTTAIVGDFSKSSGVFILRTPTDEANGMNNGNDENGIWFVDPSGANTPALNLPTLPNGWKYEGWVVTSEGPITTGTFTAFNVADDANPYSGTAASPAFPGEDFLTNAPSGFTFPLDVREKTVVISVEPDPDNATAPFALKPLVGAAVTATAPETYELGLNLNSLPTGTVTR